MGDQESFGFYEVVRRGDEQRDLQSTTIVGERVPLPGGLGMVEVMPAAAVLGAMERASEWVEAFELWLSSRRSENTRRAYQGAWEDFLGSTSRHQAADVMPWSVTKGDVLRWKGEMERRGLAQTTVQLRLAAISSFYQYVTRRFTVVRNGREETLHHFNPADAVERPSITPYGKATYLSADEVRLLLDAIPRNTVTGLRDYALFLFYIMSGRRNTEIRRLRWGDFQQKGRQVQFRWFGKGKERLDVVRPMVWAAIVAWLKAAGRLDENGEMEEGAFIFTALSDAANKFEGMQMTPGDRPLGMRSVGDKLKRYARKAGIDPRKLKIHSLRHTAAMLRIEAGTDVREVSAFLGHSSLAITQIYVDHMSAYQDSNVEVVEALIGLTPVPAPDQGAGR